MEFYVDEDTAHDVAIVHRETCGWVQDREGRIKEGRWWGPYLTADLALVAAGNTGMPVTRVCLACKP